VGREHAGRELRLRSARGVLPERRPEGLARRCRSEDICTAHAGGQGNYWLAEVRRYDAPPALLYLLSHVCVVGGRSLPRLGSSDGPLTHAQGFAIVCRWQRSCAPGPRGEGEINVVHGPDAATVASWLDVDRHEFEMV